MSFLEVKSQENPLFFINAPTGLIIREQANASSKRIGKLPYGSTVELIKKTEVKQQIIDNNDTINGTWLKIKYTNFPYIVSELKSEYRYKEEGFIFSGFTEKLTNAKIETTELDSLKFNELFKHYKTPNNIKKITSEEKTEKLLVSKVKWKDVEYLGYAIDEIRLDNGQVLRINQKSNDYGFVAYYPSEEIILFEGGHTSDYSISIKTGESLKTVGNPEYIVESPNKKLRLNGWFPGQECSSYFFQEKTEKGYKYLVEFGWGSKNYGENVCNFDKFCWINDNEFIYSYMDYSVNNSVKKYFKGEIMK